MKSEYQIGKHRFYELKHFCLQYPEWKAYYSDSDGWPKEIGENEGDTTSRDGIRRADLKVRMLQVELAGDLCGDPDVLIFVTTGIRKRDDPEFWLNYRRFFWELSRIRN